MSQAPPPGGPVSNVGDFSTLRLIQCGPSAIHLTPIFRRHMRRTNKWAESAKYWKTDPPMTNFLILAAIFFLFTAFGMVVSLFNGTWLYVPWTVAIALVSGAYAM